MSKLTRGSTVSFGVTSPDQPTTTSRGVIVDNVYNEAGNNIVKRLIATEINNVVTKTAFTVDDVNYGIAAIQRGKFRYLISRRNQGQRS